MIPKKTPKTHHYLLCLALFVCSLYACESPEEPASNIAFACETVEGTVCIAEPYSQRTGDPEKGYNYLVNDHYMQCGVPYDIYTTVFGADNVNYLNRSGDNAPIDYAYTATTAFNGVKIVAPNCFQCHAQTLNGQLIVGLGNSTSNFTQNQAGTSALLGQVIGNLYGNDSPEMKAAEKFLQVSRGLGPHLVTESRGVNVADKLAAVLAAHRNPNDLVWNESPILSIPTEVVPTEVPAWWLMKKKNVMFYTGLGRQDFAKLMMASSLLTVEDSMEANQIDTNFDDVVAYIRSLDPPPYPGEVKANLVAKGESIFNNSCASCHGTYSTDAQYPNAIIPLNYIKTDPLLAQANFDDQQFVNWFNSSWFAAGDKGALLEPGVGYIAPPLDGVWATAPYLHNGSVPTLDALLNSDSRPAYWKRTFDTSDLDYVKMGWNYTQENEKTDKDTYDTTLPGYGNEGHYFGDFLSREDRMAVIEYLKTL